MSGNRIVLLIAVALALITSAMASAAEGTIVSFVVISDARVTIDDIGQLPGIVKRIGNLRVAPDFAVSLGNNIGTAAEGNAVVDAMAYQANAGRIPCDHYYAVGDTEYAAVAADEGLTWEELRKTWSMPGNYYSFDVSGLHVCILDTALALSRPEHADKLAAQAQWLREDLAATQLPVVVLCQRSVALQKGDVAHWTQGMELEFWPEDNVLGRIIGEHANKIVSVFEGGTEHSFLREKSRILHHQVGSANSTVRPQGQFAQVFVDTATGQWFVLGDPETIDQGEQYQVQLTYGDRSLLKIARKTIERTEMGIDIEVEFGLMMQDILAADELVMFELMEVEERAREIEAYDQAIERELAAQQ